MNNYNIITLGPSGSGKTIFLASLFKVFSIQGKYSFSLEIKDPNKRIFMNKIYADLTTGEEWPPGTKNISEWSFTGYKVEKSGISKTPAFLITYVDYKGGLITDVSDDEITYSGYGDLEAYFKEADVVLVIFDGQKLLSFMQDKDLTNKVVLKWLNKDLPNLMQMVANCNKDTPLHFIISKWDLLEESYSLGDVKNRLLNNVPEFYNVVNNRRKVSCPIRLIPVSSLGKGFAVLQPDGKMKKLSVNPHPMNVEFPLAFALTDKLQNQKPFKLTIWEWIFFGLSIVFIQSTNGLSLIAIIVYFGFRLLINNKKTSPSEVALKQILSKCREIQKQFNTDFPDSDLAK
jgi:GTPase SAR1 family protein